MPCIEKSSFHPPFFLRNPHLQTLFPQKARKVKGVTYTRHRIDTPDGDFLDLDWSKRNRSRCAILFHGLEGHTFRPYMLGMVRALNRAGWDAVSVNLRGCSGEPNLLARAYHQGSSDDVATAVSHVADSAYTALIIIGFSLGGNIVLKYLGEPQWKKPDTLKVAVAVSAPCDVPSCAENIQRKENRRYLRYFLTMLSEKVIAKHHRFPEQLPVEGLRDISSFTEFDNRYTAPLNGFADARDYWERTSSLPLLPAITLPTLLLNAVDDPILTPQCFPRAIAGSHPFLTLEAPRYGGHVGFLGQGAHGNYWHEERTLEFVQHFGAAS
ncbi:MAG: alpha/beta fold hydrolase [Chitinispirillaceae bacterium]|nr:alpha/beta fold hydrolase [Chitinispirillaceae bacterium]